MKHQTKQNIFSIILASILLALMISTAHAGLDGDEEIRCAKDGETTFLFAHGLNGNPGEWDTFAKIIKNQKAGYGVWRTQVPEHGHITNEAKNWPSS